MKVSVMGSFVLYILLASLFHTVCPNDIDGCAAIHVQKDRILRTKESVNNGAKFIRRQVVQSAKECYKLCCERKDNCNLGMLSYKNSSRFQGELVRTCYLFNCGSPSKCIYSPYDHYATIEFEDGNYDKSSKTNEKTKTESTKSQKESCPPGVQATKCISDPCINAVCPSNPLAMCKPSTCGSCHPNFFDDDGNQVYCYAQNEGKKQDIQSSNKNKWIDSGIFSEVEKTHSNSRKEPGHRIIIQDLENHLHEMTKHNHKSYQSSRLHSASKDHNQHKNFWNNQGTNKNSEAQPALESRGPFHKKQPSPVTDAPFHQWRKFIDNNPDYGKAKLATEKPTAKPTEPNEPVHHWREFIDNNKNYVRTKPRTQHPTRPQISHNTKPANNDKPKPDTKHPPKVDNKNTSIKRNITDVQVVIETNHLRIVENKAVVPLAIFLVLALVMLIVVGLRLRMMKSRIRRKAFATDDADYLINGMYL